MTTAKPGTWNGRLASGDSVFGSQGLTQLSIVSMTHQAI
jgi:hypothetical protein